MSEWSCIDCLGTGLTRLSKRCPCCHGIGYHGGGVDCASERDGVPETEHVDSTDVHWLPQEPRRPAVVAELPSALAPHGLAELFQEMLWRAWAAGSLGEPFEAWYAREVMQ